MFGQTFANAEAQVVTNIILLLYLICNYTKNIPPNLILIIGPSSLGL